MNSIIFPKLQLTNFLLLFPFFFFFWEQATMLKRALYPSSHNQGLRLCYSNTCSRHSFIINNIMWQGNWKQQQHFKSNKGKIASLSYQSKLYETRKAINHINLQGKLNKISSNRQQQGTLNEDPRLMHVTMYSSTCSTGIPNGTNLTAANKSNKKRKILYEVHASKSYQHSVIPQYEKRKTCYIRIARIDSRFNYKIGQHQ